MAISVNKPTHFVLSSNEYLQGSWEKFQRRSVKVAIATCEGQTNMNVNNCR